MFFESISHVVFLPHTHKNQILQKSKRPFHFPTIDGFQLSPLVQSHSNHPCQQTGKNPRVRTPKLKSDFLPLRSCEALSKLLSFRRFISVRRNTQPTSRPCYKCQRPCRALQTLQMHTGKQSFLKDVRCIPLPGAHRPCLGSMTPTSYKRDREIRVSGSLTFEVEKKARAVERTKPQFLPQEIFHPCLHCRVFFFLSPAIGNKKVFILLRNNLSHSCK